MFGWIFWNYILFDRCDISYIIPGAFRALKIVPSLPLAKERQLTSDDSICYVDIIVVSESTMTGSGHSHSSSNHPSDNMPRSSSSSPAVTGVDLSMPFSDLGDVVPSKTSIQLYWDCPSPPGSDRRSSVDDERSPKTRHSKLFLKSFTKLRVNQPSWTVLRRTRNTICSRFCI